MQTFRLIIETVYTFVFEKYLGFRHVATQEEIKLISQSTLSTHKEKTDYTVPLMPEPPQSVTTVFDGSKYQEGNNVTYVVCVGTVLHANPVRAFDGVIMELPYGTQLRSIVSSGRWMKVNYDGIIGWVLRDELHDEFSFVYPHFVPGQYYADNSQETIKLRKTIDDMFHTVDLSMDLQDVEYVMYKLLRKGRNIPWPTERPRIAGRWQQILKGVTGVFITIHAKTDSLMEVVRSDGTGHIAYVEAVFPDQSILISEIGRNESGQYTEQTLDKDTWREMRPIFIEVA